MPRTVYYVPDALRDYQVELDSLGLAPSTAANYRGYLQRFGRICDAAGKERGKRNPLTVAELDGHIIARYFATCTGEQGNLNNMLHPLRAFLKWCEGLGELEPGAAGRLLGTRKYKKPVRKPKYYIPAEDFPDMLDAPCLTHPSHRMFIAGLLYTLGRRGEVGGLTLGQIDLDKQVLNVYRHKRNRWTEVGISPELHEELMSWLTFYGSHYDLGPFDLLEKHRDWHLIPRLVRYMARDEAGRITGNDYAAIRLNPSATPVHPERLVKGCLDYLGVVSTRDGQSVRHVGEGCHTIRRSGARAMLDHLSRDLGHERALLQVATMLDHDDPKQTLLYIGMNKERKDLNEWLAGNSMYGGAAKRRHSNVVPIRRAG